MKKTKPCCQRWRALVAVVSLPLFAAAGEAQGAPSDGHRPLYATSSSVDWKARVLRVNIALDLAAAGLRLPEGRLSAARMVEHDLPGLAKDAVFALQADSHRTVEDAVADGSLDSGALVAIAGMVKLESSSMSKDMRSFLATYTLGLDQVASLFLSGSPPTPMRAPLESRPTRVYTGIVIYAKGSLPVHGEAVEDQARPCLFPKVFDSEMSLVLDKSFVEPGALASGVLGYDSAIGVDAGARVGTDPMRVMAIGLFGDKRTDFIISRDDALRILSSAANRELLRLGKVVVVF